MLCRWRKTEKSTALTGTSTNPVDEKLQTPQIINKDHVYQALKNVRSSQAPPGEQYALTIHERNEELVARMQFTGYRMSSLASSERRNGTMDELAD